MIKQPIPFDESKIEDRFWIGEEEWDVNLPSPGFITDFLLSFRGIESCTKYQVWSAFHAISAILKRDVQFAWGPLEFFLNLYVFLVGPPSVKKSSIIRWTEVIVTKAVELIEDPYWKARKEVHSLHTKSTPEGLFLFLKPRTALNGTKVENIGSTGSIISSEVSTFLGRQQYNTGLIEILTNLYDCSAVDDSMTRSRNIEKLNHVYLTLIGGTTPSGLSDSIPEQAFGDGFLSRVILVYQEARSRKRPIPHTVPGAPTINDLAERLAWIADNARGTYDLSPEVKEHYKKWYDIFWQQEVDNPEINQRGMSRYDVHLLKLATLIRIQRYEPGNIIELQDFEEAQKLLRSTMKESFKATKSVGTSKEDKLLESAMDYIRRKGEISRRHLLTRTSSRGFKSDLINQAVRELVQREELKITLNGKELKFPSNNGKEIYTYIGNANAQEE